ncbi:D-alanyl-D-alanine carboxypeptidase family protein [Streptosporangium saharense]|uniref:D-alanyl-D-alanine carboxypeptidase family protein n=1 Tax=Streptosporangium saharense TaxID=1706840 RepID=UPI003419ADD9
MGIRHVAPVGVLLAASALLGVPAHADNEPVGGTTHSAGRTAGRAPVGGTALGARGIVAPAEVKAPPKTAAKSYVVADAETGQVLAAKDAHGRYLPASTLKTLTAVTLIPKLDKTMKVRPSSRAVNEEGSAVGLVTKPLYTVDDLFKALLLVSGNDCAMALAEANGGLDKTLREMNAEARRLQAFDTVAKTPSGLDKPGQSSSAYDLALIARAGLANRDFQRYTSTKTGKFPAPKGYYEIGNHNKLLWRYKGMIGVKNGWTSKALGSFVGAARRDGHTIIVTIMRHDGYFWDEVAGLLDWGFAARGRVTPVGTLVDPLPEAAPTPTGQAVPRTPQVARSTTPQADGSPAGGGVSPGVYAIGAGLLGGGVLLVYGLRRRSRRGSS